MPPGHTIPANLSWSVAKQLLSSQDIERLACAFLNATNPVDFNAVKAGKEFGNVKPDSFKRSIWVIAKKIKDHKDGDVGGEEDDDDGQVATPSKGRKSGGAKKRSADEDDVEVEVPSVKKQRKTGGRKGKKAMAEMTDGDGDDSAMAVKLEASAASEDWGHSYDELIEG